ncbi:MAG: PmeII family type II restriction endonuclease [Rhodocyclaceae bacterium]|nr:PmeII family type II restriction endonuclease [Rhodocyclaceae bacterium]
MKHEQAIADFIEKNIPEFHRRRLSSLEALKLDKILARKNPYLFKAKHVETAAELVRQLLEAHLSSQEETLFGEFLEALAIHVCGLFFGGQKSAAEGIDLEFTRAGKRYIVAIKSGPHWGNSQQIKRMRENFRQARRIARDPTLIAVNGCCYGRNARQDQGDYLKLCGQAFWSLISGEDEMYRALIAPLGARAKERNEHFAREYAKTLNRFTADFIARFCHADGAIDWDKLLAFNSAIAKPSVRAPCPPNSR